MLMLPVPGGTSTVISVPTTLTLDVPGMVCSADGWGVVTAVGSHAGWVAGPASVGLESGMGAVPVRLHAGEEVADRHRPPVQLRPAFRLVQSVGAEQAAKQKDPVEVLTQLLPVGQVLWSAGLHPEVHAPPVGNSGPAPQISPAAHEVTVHGLPRSALAGRFCAGQPAAGTHAPGAEVVAVTLQAGEQTFPLPAARRSVQTAPPGHVSPAQV